MQQKQSTASPRKALAAEPSSDQAESNPIAKPIRINQQFQL